LSIPEWKAARSKASTDDDNVPKLEEFREKWRNEVMPEIRRQPGCIRVEMYESSIREHWVTAISWENEESRLKALAVLSHHQKAFAQYERFEPEILILRSNRCAG